MTAAKRKSAGLGLQTRLRQLPEKLLTQIAGQDSAMERITATARRWALGLTALGPRFLCVGSTGTGKTQTALVLSEALFDRRPCRFDMSEFQDPDALQLLLGTPGGYRGRMAEACTRAEDSILLLDEIEKAHPSVRDVMLQLLEPGRVTLADGEVCDVSQRLVICTSNISSAELLDLQHLPFTSRRRHVIQMAESILRSEIVNRFDDILLFAPLEFEAQLAIGRRHLEATLSAYARCGYHVTAAPNVLEFLLGEGVDRRYGARPLRRAIERFTGEAIVADLLSGGDGTGLLRVDSAARLLVLTRDELSRSKPSS